MAILPTITLDTTLTELYKRASTKKADRRIGHILTGANSGLSLSPNFPRNTKYVYQDGPFNSVPTSELNEDNTKLQRSLVMKYLSLTPQHDAFISGDTVVIMFHVDDSDAQIAHDKSEAEESIENLNPQQKPRFVFCPGPGKIHFEEAEVDALTYKLVLDGLDQYPLTVPLDKHWIINSKGTLANSGLPTPKAEVIETSGHSREDLCCADCQSGNTIFIPPSCNGVRRKWLNEQSTRIISAIRQRRIPLVIKNQQTFGGAGTYVVASEEDREKVIKDFSSGLMNKLLSQITAENHHLKPGAVVLSDFISNPIGDYGLTFFVTDEGKAIFLAVSEQTIDENSAWVGSTINYSHRDALEKRFTPIMNRIAQWLQSYEYYVPAGADILETAAKPTNGELVTSKSELNIVDLDVRTSESMCLPLMKGHFQRRGLRSASSFSIAVKESRESFIKRWQKEFESGSMCILSWYEDPKSGESLGDVVVGPKDEKTLRQEIERVKKTTDEVTF
ncbi:MAG: hypothetical protein Q9165_001118 [Trypethelium subeluteriae]